MLHLRIFEKNYHVILLSMLLFVTCAVVHAMLSGAVHAQSVPDFSFAFTLQTDKIPLRAPAIVEFSFYNGLEEEVILDLGHNETRNFSFTIRHTDGNLVSEFRFQEQTAGPVGKVKVRAKQTYRKELLLDEEYQFQEVGPYMIQPHFLGSVQTRHQGVSEVIGGTALATLRLEILPYSAEKLAQSCQKLAQRVVHATTVSEAFVAARALSYVKDPVAIPYLVSVLEEQRWGWGKEFMIDGLGRNGSPEALQLLIGYATHNDPDVCDRARGRLQLLLGEGRVQDLAIRAQAETVLANPRNDSDPCGVLRRLKGMSAPNR
jgi:hypothetical protein